MRAIDFQGVGKGTDAAGRTRAGMELDSAFKPPFGAAAPAARDTSAPGHTATARSWDSAACAAGVQGRRPRAPRQGD
jgi:hypothetical protein